jgi:hypothetical protein
MKREYREVECLLLSCFLTMARYRILISVLYRMEHNREALDVCQKARVLYPYDASLSETLAMIKERTSTKEKALLKAGLAKAEVESRMRYGAIRFRQYPWISPALLRRSPELISSSNKVLRAYSNCIQIRRSSTGSSDTASTGNEDADCFGYFATRNIRSGELIMRAPTALGICSQQTETKCYNCSVTLTPSDVAGFSCCSTMRFCSAECRKTAQDNYHSTLCGKDFASYYKNAEKATDIDDPAILALLWLRLLACCVHSGGHPLEMPQMARLVTQYEADVTIGWSLRANVAAPLSILESFGIDIFADARYDNWVLGTMW